MPNNWITIKIILIMFKINKLIINNNRKIKLKF